MTTQLAMHNPEESHLMHTGAVEEAMEVRGCIGGREGRHWLLQ
jgi:hypothetical protein